MHIHTHSHKQAHASGPWEQGNYRHCGALVTLVSRDLLIYQRQSFHMVTPCIQCVTAMINISEKIARPPFFKTAVFPPSLWLRLHGRSRYGKIAFLSCTWESESLKPITDITMHGLVFERQSRYKIWFLEVSLSVLRFGHEAPLSMQQISQSVWIRQSAGLKV